jgi:hypothetical protein
MYSARAYWICQCLGWGLWTLANVVFYAGQSRSPRGFLAALWLGASGLLASHLMRHLIRARGWTRLSPAQAALRIIPLCLGASAVVLLWNLLAMVYVIGMFTWADTSLSGYFSSYCIWLFILTPWTALYFGAHYFARSRQAELENARLGLLVLRAQLNPHFLFNCLNSIRALITEDPPRAQQAVTQLSELLRYTLQASDRHSVPLSEELAMVEQYLALEQVRFEERLQVRQTIQPESRHAHLPPMLLQITVENALKHGISKQTAGGLITIESSLGEGQLRLRVTNPGRLPEGPVRPGIGLRYASRVSVHLEQAGDTVVAELVIPQ